jgi:hypothetical protein
MIRARRFMDAGLERPLDASAAYDLPDVVARALIATGAAVAEESAAAADSHEAVTVADTRPPETKPLMPPETKQSRRPA